MKFINIQIWYMNNVHRNKLDMFQVSVNDTLLAEALNIPLQSILKPYLSKPFSLNNVCYKYKDKLIKSRPDEDLISYITNDTIELIYSEIIALNNAANIASCFTKNGGTIDFYIFPREQNHRFTPHVKAVCQNESIRIKLLESPCLLGKERFTGNNRKNMKIALNYVADHYKFFREKWEEFVENQFN